MTRLPDSDAEAAVRPLRRALWWLALTYVVSLGVAVLVPATLTGWLYYVLRHSTWLGWLKILILMYGGFACLVPVASSLAWIFKAEVAVVPSRCRFKGALLEHVERMGALIGTRPAAIALVAGGGARAVGDPLRPFILIGEDELENLSTGRELLAIVAHEIAHIHMDHLVIGATSGLWHRIHRECQAADEDLERGIKARLKFKDMFMDERAEVLSMGIGLMGVGIVKGLVFRVWRWLHRDLDAAYAAMELAADRLAARVVGAAAMQRALRGCGRSSHAGGVGMTPGVWGDHWPHLHHPGRAERLDALGAIDASGSLGATAWDDAAPASLVECCDAPVDLSAARGRWWWRLLFGDPTTAWSAPRAPETAADKPENGRAGPAEPAPAPAAKDATKDEFEPAHTWFAVWLGLQVLAICFWIGVHAGHSSRLVGGLAIAGFLAGCVAIAVLVSDHTEPLAAVLRRINERLRGVAAVRDWEARTSRLLAGARGTCVRVVCATLTLMGCFWTVEAAKTSGLLSEALAWVLCAPVVGTALFAVEAIGLSVLGGAVEFDAAPEATPAAESAQCSACERMNEAAVPLVCVHEVERRGDFSSVFSVGSALIVMIGAVVMMAYLELPEWFMFPVALTLFFVCWVASQPLFTRPVAYKIQKKFGCLYCSAEFVVTRTICLRAKN